MASEKILSIPYGKESLQVKISEENLLNVIEPIHVSPEDDLKSMVKAALKNPFDSKSIKEKAIEKNAQNAVIVITDITRPCPDDIFLPPILNELEQAGISSKDITIMIALGMHRPCTKEEMINKLGSELYYKYNVINSEPTNEEKLTYLGMSSQGCPIYINSLVAETDFVISTGVIEPHLFAGYSGSRKSIAIGVAGEETIQFQHRPFVFENPLTRIGQIQGNPFHDNALEIAKIVGLDFTVNGILNAQGEIFKVVAGDPEVAFYKGVEYAANIFENPIESQADIVIAGVTYPKSTNIFQATRSASYIAFSPFPAVKKGGLVIIPASTEEGVGNGKGEQRYYEITKNSPDLETIISDAKENKFQAGGHRAYIMAMTLQYEEVIIVGSKTPDIVEDLYMKHCDTLEEALEIGYKKYGSNAKVSVIPHSLHVFTTKKEVNVG